ncbi:MAG: hypothetical protein KJ623_02270 [Nanoarchaeota archaeon]|nr:hypothetical protein [Nanoarchaeota archaeon]
MDNTKLFNICLLLSILGVFCLLIFGEFSELEETPIKDIDYRLMDQIVKTSGMIDNIRETKGLYILDLKENSDKIIVIIFKKGNLTFEKNSRISVEGSVTEYDGQTEIIAKRIIK